MTEVVKKEAEIVPVIEAAEFAQPTGKSSISKMFMLERDSGFVFEIICG